VEWRLKSLFKTIGSSQHCKRFEKSTVKDKEREVLNGSLMEPWVAHPSFLVDVAMQEF